MSVTRRFVILIACGLVLLIPAAFFQARIGLQSLIFMSYNIFCLILLLLDYIFSRRTNFVALRRPDEEKLYFKTENIIGIFAVNNYSAPLQVTLKDSLPNMHFHLTGRNEMTQKMAPGEELLFTYEVIPSKRGAFEFTAVHGYIVSMLGFCRIYFERKLSKEYKVYPNLRDLSKYRMMTNNKRLKPRGERQTRLRGLGTEFESLREYVEGDDFRKINWQATARENNFIVNQFQIERNQPIFSMLDAGRSMGYSIKGYKKLDYAINACLTLSDIVNQQGDNSGIMVFDKSVKTIIMPGKGDVHRNLLMEALYHIEDTKSASDYEGAFLELLNKQKRHCLVFLFTDFETPEQARDLAMNIQLIKRRHTPFIVMMENESLDNLLNTDSASMAAKYEKAV
ncbi:MAG: DUF58 domain-containing protein, partial [Clostridiales bacterium]|nr:DUF58 domain-containing protein [Clostridiales bacterium]